MEPKLALLHTATANAVTFDRLGSELAPDIPLQHVVDDSLISEARASGGVTPELNRRVSTAALNALDSGAKVLLCTCSSIGPCVEVSRPFTDRPILRIDDPMAKIAVETGSRIIVAATLQTTLEPTKAIVQRAADEAGKTIELIDILCDSAWKAFETGDQEGYESEIVASLQSGSAGADVIVLAQASMAGAADRLESEIPVLTSPRSGFEAAIEVYRKIR
jgi:Asp/Glu/hydantoin racemase